MARKQKTISIRKLARKDRDDVITLEMQAKAAELFKRAGFKPVIMGPSTSRISVHGKGPDHEWRIHAEMYPHVNPDRAVKAVRRRRAIKINQYVNELWIIGETLSQDLESVRHEFGAGVRVITLEELEKTLDRDHPFGKSPRLLPSRDIPAAR